MKGFFASGILVALFIILIRLCGCATIEQAAQALDEYWQKIDAAQTNAPAQPPPEPPPAVEPPQANPADEADFSTFEWRFGGFNGKNAALSAPRIAGLKFGPRAMIFAWRECMESWGVPNRDAGAVCAAFFQTADGRWIGGKFDWISCPDRSSRDYKHLIGPEPYGGWSMAGFPNPCKGAFVVVSRDGKKRSNVVVGEWKR